MRRCFKKSDWSMNTFFPVIFVRSSGWSILWQSSSDALTSLDRNVFQNIVYRFSDLNSIKQIAARNLAIAILPRQLNQDSADRWQLKLLEIADVDLSFTVGLVRNAGGLLSRAEECTIEMLKEISQAK